MRITPDVNLLWDAMRCLIRVCAQLASGLAAGGRADICAGR